MGSETHASPAEVGAVSGNGAAAAEVETEKSRRALLKGLGVAAAGAVVGSILSPEEAEAHHGTINAESNTGNPAVHAVNNVGGDGVVGTSASGSGFGRGVFGVGSGGHIGVEGVSQSGPGVKGGSGSGIGVDGSSDSLIGVNGSSPNGIGVEGFSENGIGVDGNGGNVGVVGSSQSGTGVFAQTGNGLALDVHGPAKFSTAGAGAIPVNQNSVVVSDSAVTADSHITMTLTGNPGSVVSGVPAMVVWAERHPGIGFTARLSRKVANATPFTYLIVEPG